MEMNVENIWSDYRENLRAFLLSRVRNPDDADDLLQDILIKVHRYIGDIQKVSSLKAWLFQITQNTITDYYRAQKRSDSFNTNELLPERETEDDHMLEACVEPFVDALPEKYRALLRAVDLEGKSQKQVAEELGVSYSTLKSRVQKARENLLSLFENCCHFSRDAQGNIVDYQTKSDSCQNC